MNKIIKYSTRYLSADIVGGCYEKGKHNLVDKTQTGNGFTTGSLNLPIIDGKTDLIIVPNKKVVQSKQQSYVEETRNEDPSESSKRMGFIYGDISSDKLDFEKFDVIMLVVDSFLLLQDTIRANKYKVGRILLDEVHSRLIQSIFRHNLIGFNKVVEEMFPDKAIVSVTASPMLFQEPDIKIIPETIEQKLINVSYNQRNTLTRLKAKLDNGEKCIVALQDARILKNLVNESGILKANFKTGVTLFESILEVAKVEECEESNLVIISSAGFEGFDVNNGKHNVFIFEDRAFDYQTFYTQNVYQVIGRPREGTLYIEWNRIANRNRATLIDIEEVKRIASSTKISNEKKLTDKNYRGFMTKYCTSTIEDVKTGLITELVVDEELYKLDEELHNSDVKGLGIYDDFLADRGIKLNILNDGDSRLPKSVLTHKTKHKNTKKNKDIIEAGGYFENPKLDLSPKNGKKYQTTLNQYANAYKKYLRRKYWYCEFLAWDERTTSEDIGDSVKFERELKCLRMLLDEKGILNDIKHLVKRRKLAKKEELGKDSKEYKIFAKEIEEKLSNIYPRLLMALSQGKISVPKKIRNGRDFNLTTECSMQTIEEVANLFNIQVTEVDIISCNIRILYAINGLALPNNIYGKNKVNKKKINTLLNKISKYQAIEKKADVAKWKKNRVEEMRKYGFDEKVISYLITNFFDTHKDAVYNVCANHEQRIINKLMSRLIGISDAGGCDVRFVRRHDSILVFGWWNESFDRVLESFQYEDVRGWFIQSDDVVLSSQQIDKVNALFEDMKVKGEARAKVIELTKKRDEVKAKWKARRKLYNEWKQHSEQVDLLSGDVRFVGEYSKTG